jgi:predicted ArsR family transcriptional regulator
MNDTDRITNWINSILHEVSKLEADEGAEILNNCGVNCSKSSVLLEGAIKIHDIYSDTDDLDIIFKAFKKKYYNTSNFEKDENIITLIFEECTCPMVKQGVDNSFLCNCTVGYSMNLFKALFGRPVKVKLLKSILNGDDICKQEISIEVE